MIFDAIPFSIAQRNAPKALRSFVDFFEKKYGAFAVYDAQSLPLGRIDLLEQTTLAQTLLEAGIIQTYYPNLSPPDEPPLRGWVVTYGDPPLKASGTSWESDLRALMAGLAEALERYLWKNRTDFFKHPISVSQSQLRATKTRHVPLSRFASYSDEQRSEEKALHISEETPFVWTKGLSLVSGKDTYIPAQTISGVPTIRFPGVKSAATGGEPMVRARHTIGLATWPTQAGAQLAGALECIEREAYMIMWFNQLTLPRLDTAALCSRHNSLSKFIDMCDRYRLRVHCIPLLTDAPTHVIMTVIEDLSGHEPRFSIGLKAHRSLVAAIEKSASEALLERRAGRQFLSTGPWNTSIPVRDVGHRDRIHYWTLEEHAHKLEFLIRGEIRETMEQPWENDTTEQHLRRIIEWCRKKNFEFVSVPLTHSKKNPTSLHIESVAIPELQQTHLIEKDLMMGGSRWRTVPESFGITPRKTMFTGAPHPF